MQHGKGGVEEGLGRHVAQPQVVLGGQALGDEQQPLLGAQVEGGVGQTGPAEVNGEDWRLRLGLVLGRRVLLVLWVGLGLFGRVVVQLDVQHRKPPEVLLPLEQQPIHNRSLFG